MLARAGYVADSGRRAVQAQDSGGARLGVGGGPAVVRHEAHMATLPVRPERIGALPRPAAMGIAPRRHRDRGGTGAETVEPMEVERQSPSMVDRRCCQGTGASEVPSFGRRAPRLPASVGEAEGEDGDSRLTLADRSAAGRRAGSGLGVWTPDLRTDGRVSGSEASRDGAPSALQPRGAEDRAMQLAKHHAGARRRGAPRGQGAENDSAESRPSEPVGWYGAGVRAWGIRTRAVAAVLQLCSSAPALRAGG